MRHLILCSVLGLSLAATAQAQKPPTATPADPAAAMQSWYRHFLGRDVDQVGLNHHVDAMRRGRPAAEVVADILASNEYYKRAGSTPHGYIRTLFIDLAGRQPTPEELKNLGSVRPDQRREVAAIVLRRFPKAWQNAGNSDSIREE